MHVPVGDRRVAVTVAEPVFYDPSGARVTRTIGASALPERRLVASTVDLPAARAVGEARLTICPDIRKFSVRTSQPLAPPLRAKGGALWLGPDEYLMFRDETPRVQADSVVDVFKKDGGVPAGGTEGGVVFERVLRSRSG